ncbi:hypothetical protein GN958_ATG07210 [Phytophthora infestans]|uniref:Uncharacterized protein n=1 Tax=Phytophthora infestans TaxID=4787 RepID=A0A8S9UUT9_PHYIN|nr:hypothetical protein GN958_ATG07210 [Phytophthora infestans]
MAGRRKRSLDSAPVDSSKRTRPRRGSAACEAEGTTRFDNSMFFKVVWKELGEERWTSKRPPRNALDSFYRYIRPGSDLKGKGGKDFFVGEEALLAFYLREIALSPATRITHACHHSYNERQSKTSATNPENVVFGGILAEESTRNGYTMDNEGLDAAKEVVDTEERRTVMGNANSENEHLTCGIHSARTYRTQTDATQYSQLNVGADSTDDATMNSVAAMANEDIEDRHSGKYMHQKNFASSFMLSL